jgi:hypothetical protein
VAVKGSAEWRPEGGLFVVPAGLYSEVEVAAVTEAEFFETAASFRRGRSERRWRWFNQVGAEGVGSSHHRLDEMWEILAYLEHYLRGEPEPRRRDEIYWHADWLISDHLVPLLRLMRRDDPRREAVAELVFRWAELERDPEAWARVAREQQS